MSTRSQYHVSRVYVKTKLISVTIFFLALLIFAEFPEELLAAPYYQGKIITIICSAAPGGGYDTPARLMAKYLPKYIPGKPTIIVQNMPGAGGVVAANYLFNVAKPDGQTIGIIHRGLPFTQLLKAPGVRFDLRKFAWLGSVGVEVTTLAIRSDLPYRTFQDLQKAKGPVYLANTGPTAKDGQWSNILKEFLGLNLRFTVYPATTDCALAIERREADGRGGSFSSVQTLFDRGVVRLVLRSRASTSEIENLHLPIDEDMTTDKMGKTIMALLTAPDRDCCRPFLAPPKTPSEAVGILREAFAITVKDQEFLKDAMRLNMQAQFVPPTEGVKTLNYIFNQPDEVVKILSKYLTF